MIPTTYTGSWRLSEAHTTIRKAADAALAKVAERAGLAYTSELHIWKTGAMFTPYFNCSNTEHTGGALRVNGKRIRLEDGVILQGSGDEFDVSLSNGSVTTGMIVHELMGRLPKFVEHVTKCIEKKYPAPDTMMKFGGGFKAIQ